MIYSPPKIPAIPFTQEAFDKMKAELAQLKIERKAVLIRLQAAREMGDLSENGAYTYAKLELGSISRQQRELRHLIDNGKVQHASSTGSVGFGNTVVLQTAEGKKIAYTIVSIHESDLAAHKLSTESPLGSAIMGKKIGEKVNVQAPSGEKIYTVVEIQ